MPDAPALLVLEDGTVFRGEAAGAPGTAFGEVVFNTAMSGYQEVITDPSYHRQIVAMTYPHQGNYGVNDEDAESAQVQVAGFVVRELSRMYSNQRAQRSLRDELVDGGVVAISEVDTRRLTRHLRSHGALRGGVSTEVLEPEALRREVLASPEMAGAELASAVTTPAAYVWRGAATPPQETLPTPATERPAGSGRRVAVLDFGLKQNQLRLLAALGCELVVVPATAPAADVLALEPDGVFLSNGPGDPAAVRQGITTISELLGARVPLFGICLGHQLLGLALGARTFKLRFGHHGVNHPVRNLATGRIEIASHNHGFAIDRASLADLDRQPGGGGFGRVVETHVNLNDGTNAGIRCLDAPAFSVQYHPESAPGPHDSRYLFDDFVALVDAEGARA
jgi:carbamoyl-phosphate synthase small subunit